MTRRTFLPALASVFLAALSVRAAERVWQKGTWRKVQAERPKVTFGITTRDPNSNLPQAATAREVRTYVIATATELLELRQDATVSAPRIVAIVGDTVDVAIENKTVYVKDEEGTEHKLLLRKRTPLTK